MLTVKNGRIATQYTTFEMPDGFQICTDPVNREIGMQFQRDDDIYLAVYDDEYDDEFRLGTILDDINFIQEDGFFDLIERPTEVERNGIKGWKFIYRNKAGCCEFYEERYQIKGQETDREVDIILSTNIGEGSKRKSVKDLFDEPCVKRFLANVEINN